MTPAAGALDIAAGSPRHYILRRLYGALILGAGKIIVRRRNLKEDRDARPDPDQPRGQPATA